MLIRQNKPPVGKDKEMPCPALLPVETVTLDSRECQGAQSCDINNQQGQDGSYQLGSHGLLNRSQMVINSTHY